MARLDRTAGQQSFPDKLSTALENWSVSAVKSEHFSTMRE
jgi:hypothetical protein